MSFLRFLRISAATVIALTTPLTTFLAGCATKSDGPPPQDPPHPILHGDPPPPPPPCDMVHPVFNHLLFQQGKAELGPEAKAEADKICAELKAYPKDTVTIEGHTSDTGTPEFNMALGLRRAQAAKAYLVEQGIAGERIEMRSYGETKPAVPNDSPANRKLNQRVAFAYHINE